MDKELGKKHSSLTIIERVVAKFPSYRCVCSCGNYTIARIAELKSGHKKTCGCRKGLRITHGYSMIESPDTEKYKMYQVWSKMKQRCENKYDKAYENYGGRGIKICKEWKNDFEKFILDMGHRPSSKYSIERIDNNGNYEARNCKWIMRGDQNKNKRNSVLIKFNGITKSATDWSKDVGIATASIIWRIKNGWSAYDTLHKKTSIVGRRTNGRTKVSKTNE